MRAAARRSSRHVVRDGIAPFVSSELRKQRHDFEQEVVEMKEVGQLRRAIRYGNGSAADAAFAAMN